MVFTRRNFMCGATATTLSVPALMRALASEASAASNTILVLYEMNGGNDAFNMVVPLDSAGFSKYNSLRNNIALAEPAIENAQTYFDATPSPVGQGSTYGFHPRMGPSSPGATNNLRSLYAQGKVAVIMGSGLPYGAYSRDGHQQAQFYWATSGVNNLGTTNVGWLGQAFDQIGDNGVVPAMIAVDGSSEIALTGNKTAPLIIGGDIGNFNPNYGPAGGTAGAAALAGNNGYVTQPLPSEFARMLGGQTTGFVSTIKSYATAEAFSTTPGAPLYYNTNYVFNPGGAATGSYVKSQLKQVARMILAGAPTRAYYVRQGGYDTHGAQRAGQDPLLGEFSEAVTEFYQFLKAQNKSSNVLIATVSDFGRRAYSNSTAGTDHGTATIHYMIGDPVVGGTYFNSAAPAAPSGYMPSGVTTNGVSATGYPDISKLDNNQFVVVSIDFRYQLSALIQFLGTSPSNIVGSSFASIAGTGASSSGIKGILGSYAI